jgi:uncharacterized protein with GYD domain
MSTYISLIKLTHQGITSIKDGPAASMRARRR